MLPPHIHLSFKETPRVCVLLLGAKPHRLQQSIQLIIFTTFSYETQDCLKGSKITIMQENVFLYFPFFIFIFFIFQVIRSVISHSSKAVSSRRHAIAFNFALVITNGCCVRSFSCRKVFFFLQSEILDVSLVLLQAFSSIFV